MCLSSKTLTQLFQKRTRSFGQPLFKLGRQTRLSLTLSSRHYEVGYRVLNTVRVILKNLLDITVANVRLHLAEEDAKRLAEESAGLIVHANTTPSMLILQAIEIEDIQYVFPSFV